MRRRTKHDYRAPGSFERIEEAALALADTDAEDDVGYHRNKARLRAAVLSFLFEKPTRRRCDAPEQVGLPLKLGARSVPK